MTTPEEPRHRRRRRHGRAQQRATGAAEGAQSATDSSGDGGGGRGSSEGDSTGEQRPRKAGRRPGGHGGHGGRDPMRDLAGTGRSTVGVEGALRARDVNRPTPDDLAAAEGEVQLVRRHWTPPSQGG